MRDDSKSINMILYQEPHIAIPEKSLANMFLGVGLRVSLLFLVQVYHPILEANQFGLKLWAVQRLPGYIYIYHIGSYRIHVWHIPTVSINLSQMEVNRPYMDPIHRYIYI